MANDPGRLRQLREEIPLSQEELARKSGVDKRTIQRLETDDAKLKKARPITLHRLANALEVDPGVLQGRLPIPKRAERKRDPLRRQQLNVRISREARNAFTFVSMRYGITPTTIIEMAPLFFLLLAEDSLHRRWQKLNEIRCILDDLDTNVPQYLNFGLPLIPSNELVQSEESSINNIDISGKYLLDLDKLWDSSYEHDRDNPFAVYLREFVDRINKNELVSIEDYTKFTTGDMPSYKVCRNFVGELAGGDEELTEALMDGFVLLHEMPKELWKEENLEERQQWLRTQMEKERKALQEEALQEEDRELDLDLSDLSSEKNAKEEGGPS